MPVKQQIGIVISNKTKDYCGKIEKISTSNVF
jgi:hypothetical protein